MARKNSNGQGCIYKKKVDNNGKCILWGANIMIGYNEEGKKKVKTLYGKTQKEVTENLEQYKRDMLLTSSNIDYDKLTLQDYYTWLMNRKKHISLIHLKIMRVCIETIYKVVS